MDKIYTIDYNAQEGEFPLPKIVEFDLVSRRVVRTITTTHDNGKIDVVTIEAVKISDGENEREFELDSKNIITDRSVVVKKMNDALNDAIKTAHEQVENMKAYEQFLRAQTVLFSHRERPIA